VYVGGRVECAAVPRDHWTEQCLVAAATFVVLLDALCCHKQAAVITVHIYRNT
jgi:hypothetical protein